MSASLSGQIQKVFFYSTFRDYLHSQSSSPRHLVTTPLVNIKQGTEMKCCLVTGGMGFIGSCFVLQQRKLGVKIINLDKLTYAGNPNNLQEIRGDDGYVFVRGGIENEELVRFLLHEFTPDAVINFAAESHVDRSIHDPEAFVRTNVLGTSTLLRTVRDWWHKLPCEKSESFRFLHISTDEVYGSLHPSDPAFTETTAYSPNSPYSASKAASDHMVRCYFETYGLPILVTNCSNNYGPRQFPEKLIPLIILNAINQKPLPIYGTGENIRDWLHVEDHCRAIAMVLEKGRPGQSYNIGGRSERTNLQIVSMLCKILNELRPLNSGAYEELISFVSDRPGHDFRYAIDSTKIESELGWKAAFTLENGLTETVHWYLNNPQWIENVRSGAYLQWMAQNYSSRSRQELNS